MQDLYELLGVGASSDVEEIKKAYKTKAAELHPDKNPGCTNCQERFNDITKAYETLLNPESRKFYDAVRSSHPDKWYCQSLEVDDPSVDSIKLAKTCRR